MAARLIVDLPFSSKLKCKFCWLLVTTTTSKFELLWMDTFLWHSFMNYWIRHAKQLKDFSATLIGLLLPRYSTCSQDWAISKPVRIRCQWYQGISRQITTLTILFTNYCLQLLLAVKLWEIAIHLIISISLIKEHRLYFRGSNKMFFRLNRPLF